LPPGEGAADLSQHLSGAIRHPALNPLPDAKSQLEIAEPTYRVCEEMSEHLSNLLCGTFFQLKR